MEGLMKRVVTLTGFFAVAAVVFLALPSRAESNVDEKWMKDHAPETIPSTELGTFTYEKSAEDPQISYKADAQTYDMLKPFGIVSRKYGSGGRQYDVVLIAGNDKENFHDPHVCFRAQGWTFTKDTIVKVPTKTRGMITATLAQIENRGRSTFALFFYRGPKAFYPSTPNLGTAMLLGPLMGDFKTDAVFYRFMPEYPDPTEKDLVKFASEFMDAAGKSSDNYF